jgi:hypothetical protein
MKRRIKPLASIIGEHALSDSSLPEFHAAMADAGYTAVTDECAVDWLHRYERWYASWGSAEARGIDIPEFTI